MVSTQRPTRDSTPMRDAPTTAPIA